MKTLALAAIAAAAVIMSYNGVFYITGRQYYEACFQKEQASAVLAEQAKPPDPQTAILWASCEPIAAQALLDSGLRAQDHEEGGGSYGGCPDFYSEIWWFAFYRLVIDSTAAFGGPTFFEGYTPAGWMVQRVIRARWPNCRDKMQREGDFRLLNVACAELQRQAEQDGHSDLRNRYMWAFLRRPECMRTIKQ